MTCNMRALEKLLSWRLRSLADHMDFEDITQECRIAAWRAVTNHEGGCSHNRLIVAAIDAEAIDFLRSPMNRKRTRTRDGFERVVPVTLDVRDGPEEKDGWRYPEPEPRIADFVTPLLDHLYGSWVWSLRRRLLTPGQIQVLEQLVLEDQGLQAVIAGIRRSKTRVYQHKEKALGRYRAFLGVESDD